jgi:hypothetical protein
MGTGIVWVLGYVLEFIMVNIGLSRQRSGGGSEVGKNLVRVVYANLGTVRDRKGLKWLRLVGKWLIR